MMDFVWKVFITLRVMSLDQPLRNCAQTLFPQHHAERDEYLPDKLGTLFPRSSLGTHRSEGPPPVLSANQPLRSCAQTSFPQHHAERDEYLPGKTRRRASIVVLASLLLLITSSFARAADEDERFVAGLRERRLFTLAEAYCRERLQDPKLDPARRATLTIETMLTLSQQALYAPPGEREKYWQQARALADKLPDEQSRKVVIDLQAALITLAQGEVARQEAEAADATPEDFAPAQKFLRTATLELEALEKRLAQQIATRREAAPSELSANELFALQQNTRFQLARARRNQGLCYPAKSNDRVAALEQAVEILDKLRPQLGNDDPLVWRVQIAQGTDAHLLENTTAAIRIFQDLLASDQTPPAIVAQARAELARAMLAANQSPYEAFKVLDAGRTSAEATSPELEFALLEVRIAQWKEALASQDTANAERFRDDAVEQLALLEKQFGAYWSRRGERLLLSVSGGGDRSLEILVRSADARFLKNQFDDETFKLYDQAAKLAQDSKNLKKYLELSYRAATVQERQGKTEAAAARMQQLGQEIADLVAPEDPLFSQSGAMHWQGLLLAKPMAKPDELIAKYQEHLSIWPRQTSADEVRCELGALYEQAEKWPESLEAYQQVALDHPRALVALQGAARVWPKQLEAIKSKPAAHAAAVQQAIAYFRSAIGPADGAAPEKFNDVQRMATLCCARLLLDYTATGGAAAETLLTAALTGSVDATPAWKQAAQAQLVVALAAQPGKQQAAEALIQKLGQENPGQLLTTLHSLAQRGARAKPEVRADLAKLQLASIAQLKPQADKLTAPQRGALLVSEAEALAAAGERAAALDAYRALVKAQPQNGAAHEGYATLLAASEDKASLEQALAQWRMLAQASKPQGDRWWRAKYQVALLNYQLGDKAQAAQLIRYLDVTPPGLKGTPLEKEFRALLLKVQ